MGYELHITRQNDYESEDEESSITLAEWLAYIESDQELKLTNGYQMTIPNIMDSWVDEPGFCLWTAHPENKPIDSLWFDFKEGTISAKYPDDATIKKMISIAKALGGEVHGDENEPYDESYFDNKSHSDTTENLDNIPQVNKKPWWKFW